MAKSRKSTALKLTRIGIVAVAVMTCIVMEPLIDSNADPGSTQTRISSDDNRLNGCYELEDVKGTNVVAVKFDYMTYSIYVDQDVIDKLMEAASEDVLSAIGDKEMRTKDDFIYLLSLQPDLVYIAIQK